MDGWMDTIKTHNAQRKIDRVIDGWRQFKYMMYKGRWGERETDYYALADNVLAFVQSSSSSDWMFRGSLFLLVDRKFHRKPLQTVCIDTEFTHQT